MAGLSLQNINKVYDGNVHAVIDCSVDIADGEFVVLVGPSGCGKSTTLRMIAGLEDITTGKLYIGDEDMTTTPPKDRDIAMVFQNYALYAHLTVYHNMAFSLVLRHEKPEVIHEKVMAAARILELESQLNKKPSELSGGQRQRVAVGRAIVRDPKVFLFDEPLSNLDAKLRGSMRREIKLLHMKLGTTIIYVTHDQTEALTLADKIVCMADGKVQQIGKPIELYDHPKNLFVASFIGLPPMNFFDVRLENGKLVSPDLTYALNEEEKEKLAGYEGRDLVFGVRPEDINLGDEMKMKISINENLGMNTLLHGYIGKKRIVAKIADWCEYKLGDEVGVTFDRNKVHFFDKETTEAIE